MLKPTVFELASEELRGLVARRSRSASETLFDRFPEMRSDRETALEIIYYEYVLRKEQDESDATVDEFCQRFPDLREDIVKLFQVDEAFHSLGMEGPSTTVYPLDHRTHRTAPALETQTKPPDTPLGYIGDYRLVRVIGRGGMGMVYQAVQERLGRIVALKTISLIESLDATTISRFRKEAELASSLQHPNIAQIYEIGSHTQVPYYSMEFVAGGSLADAVRTRPLRPETAASIVSVLARAVDYAHRQGVLHRDLKPANVLLAPSHRPEAIQIPAPSGTVTPNPLDGQNSASNLEGISRFEPKIIDFGLAADLKISKDSSDHRTIGTPSYMSPEQAHTGSVEIGEASDIYSLGAILYHLLVGRPPFNAATSAETVRQVLDEEAVAPRSLQPRIPVDLETICMKCLRKNPASRYQTGLKLADDLQRYMEGKPIHARRTPIRERVVKWSKRNPSAAILILSFVLAVSLITWLWRRSESFLVSERNATDRLMLLSESRDLSLAYFEYRSNNVEKAVQLLEKCRPEFRNWEWHYLNQLCREPFWQSPSENEFVSCASMSNDGRYVAIGLGRWGLDMEQTIKVWDTQENRIVHTLTGHPNCEITTVEFSPDGKSILTGGYVWENKKETGKVIVYDFETGKVKFVLANANSMTAKYSPDGQNIFVGFSSGAVVQYSSSGKRIRDFPWNASLVLSLAICSDNKRLVASARSGIVCAWDITSGRELDRIEVIRDPRHVAWSPDTKRILVGEYSGMVRTFRFEKNHFVLETNQTRPAKCQLEYSPDGLSLATAAFGEGAELRDANTGRVLRKLPGHRGHVMTIGFCANGRRLFTGGADGSVRVWNLEELDPFVKRVHLAEHLSDAAFQPGGSLFAVSIKAPKRRKQSANNEARIELIDSSTLKIVRTLKGHTEWANCVSFREDGRLLATGADDGTVRLWDPEKDVATSLLQGHRAPVLEVEFMHGGNQIVSVDQTGQVIVWGKTSTANYSVTATFHVLSQSNGASNQVPVVAIANQPGILIVASHGKIESWNIDERKKCSSTPFGSTVNILTVSPDKKLLAIGSKHPTIHVWEISQMMRSEPVTPKFEMAGHLDEITSLAFSPDSLRLASGSKDETVRTFDLNLGAELVMLDGLEGVQNLVAFSQDGKQFVHVGGTRISMWKFGSETRGSTEDRADITTWHRERFNDAFRSRNAYAMEFHTQKLLTLAPNSVHSWESMGFLYADQGEWSKSKSCFAKALEVQDSSMNRMMSAICALALKDPEELGSHSQTLLESAIQRNDAKDLNSAAWLLSMTNKIGYDPTSLVPLMERICSTTQEGLYENTLALVYYRARQYEQAMATAKLSIKRNKVETEPFNWLILALCRCRLILEGYYPEGLSRIESLRDLNLQLNSIVEWKRRMDNRRMIGFSDSISDVINVSIDVPILRDELQELLNEIDASPLLKTKLEKIEF